MLRQLCFMIALAGGVHVSHAAEAGKAIFVAGAAQIAGAKLVEGAAVQEGDLLSTGADGFIYVKTVDNGLFILRPNTKARIVAYHIDAKQPANTRIKLELLSGVARSRSGDAVKLARQNFRFNTPVAAIGVRGTDFTVFTDQDTSRVAVLTGGIVVSAFGGGCRPEGVGPCEGASSRELSAAQRGVLLQVQRGQHAPQLMQGDGLGPDQVAPPRIDEPIGKSAGGNKDATPVSTVPILEAKKNNSLNQVKEGPPTAPVVVAPTKPAPVQTPAPDPVKPAEPVKLPEAKIVWGRWQPLLDTPGNIDLARDKGTSDLISVNGNFVLMRTQGKAFVSPNEGKVGFSLRDGEAYIYTQIPVGYSAERASLSDGKLIVDFGSRTFDTSMNLGTPQGPMNLQAHGAVTADGRLLSDQALGRRGFIDVQGLLSNENSGSAAYVFDGTLGPGRTVNGVTYWRK